MFDDFDTMEEGGDDSFGTYTPEEPDGLKPPRDSTLCLGHEKIEKTLLDYISSGAVPHAMIFAGPVGIGKSTMAFRLARYLLKNGTPDTSQDSLFGDATPAPTTLDVPANDPTFAKVASGGHPDFLSLEYSLDPKKSGKNAPIDVYTARKVAPFLRMTASNGGWRVVIVDNADTLNRNSQNALLKILEEPPSNALLILVTHRLGAMIPTIRSRCRVLHFDPLTSDNLADLMKREVGNTISGHDLQILNLLSAGSIGTAQNIIETGGIETAQSVMSILGNYPNFNGVDIHHLAENAGRFGSKESVFNNIESTFLTLVENIIFAHAKNQDTLPAPLNEGAFMTMMNAHTLETWLDIFEKLKAHFSQTKYSNLDKRQGVIGAFNIIAP